MSRTTYAALFSTINTLYGVGEHTHNINDPGHDHGGNTGEAAYPKGVWAFNAFGGIGSDLGNHSHSISRDETGINILLGGIHSHPIAGITASTGQGKAFSIMPPYQIVNYIIYAGPNLSETIG